MKSMRIVGMLIFSILITSGTAFAKSYYLVSESPCRSEIVVVERSYCSPCREIMARRCSPCPDRIACIKEDTLITEARADILACKIAKCKISPVCCTHPCCCPSTVCCPVKTSCFHHYLSVVKAGENDPCFEARVDRKLDSLNGEIELLKGRVRSLEIEVY